MADTSNAATSGISVDLNCSPQTGRFGVSSHNAVAYIQDFCRALISSQSQLDDSHDMFQEIATVDSKALSLRLDYAPSR